MILTFTCMLSTRANRIGSVVTAFTSYSVLVGISRQIVVGISKSRTLADNTSLMYKNVSVKHLISFVSSGYPDSMRMSVALVVRRVVCVGDFLGGRWHGSVGVSQSLCWFVSAARPDNFFGLQLCRILGKKITPAFAGAIFYLLRHLHLP